ncbi:MAG: M23 family metallopeptidase [Roseburia sp.]|nr:M23 family metallopeptidase [Roseburia sp.]
MKRKTVKIASIAIAATAFTIALFCFAGCKSGEDGENGEHGIHGIQGVQGIQGEKGVGVESGKIDENGNLILTLTDGSETNCGKIPDVHKHEFCDWALIAKETCTTAGLELRGCECGHTESKITPATGHDWGIWAMTDASSHSRSCTDCKITVPAQHHYADGVCTDCGYTQPSSYGLPLAEIDIITDFGYMPNPLIMNTFMFHAGLDFAAEVGDEVFAVTDGEITAISINDMLKGTTIKIAPEKLSGYAIEYQFAYPVEGLKVGDKVKKGDVIGNIEECLMRDFTTKIHLHLALTVNGEAKNPEEYIDFVTARDEHMHSFGEGEIVKEATCTEDGSLKKVCACGYTYNIVIPAAHGESKYEKVSGSKHEVKCSVCNETLKTESHKFKDNVCSLCGYVMPEAPLDGLVVVASTAQGIDFAAEVGDSVYATYSGTVESIKMDESGTTITLAHENGYKTIYSCVTPNDGLETGAKISAGAAFCTVEKAAGVESDEGTCLHYAVERDGQLIDPLTVFEDLSA